MSQRIRVRVLSGMSFRVEFDCQGKIHLSYKGGGGNWGCLLEWSFVSVSQSIN